MQTGKVSKDESSVYLFLARIDKNPCQVSIGGASGSASLLSSQGILPGESHGQRSLVGCSPWGRTESDTTEVT